ncbi:MAG: hypothetical protein ABJH91_14710 [Balneola sp.]
MSVFAVLMPGLLMTFMSVISMLMGSVIVPFMMVAGMIVFFVVMLMAFMPSVLVSPMVVSAVIIMYMALLLTGFLYFVYQGFRLIWFRLFHPGKTAQALPDGGQCGLKKIFFQSNVYIRVRQWVKMFWTGHHQHPGTRHLSVNGSSLFCHNLTHTTNNQQNIGFSWIGSQSCFSI